MVSTANLDLSGLSEAIAEGVKEGVANAQAEILETGYVKKEDVAKMVQEGVEKARTEMAVERYDTAAGMKEVKVYTATAMHHSNVIKEITERSAEVLGKILPHRGYKPAGVIIVKCRTGVYAALSELRKDTQVNFSSGAYSFHPKRDIEHTEQDLDVVYIRSHVTKTVDRALDDLLQVVLELATSPRGQIQLAASERHDVESFVTTEGVYYTPK